MKKLVFLIFIFSFSVYADNLKNLPLAYPNFISRVNQNEVIWKDGTKMPINSGDPSLMMQMQADYPLGKILPETIMKEKKDPGRERYLPFFEKMYGSTKDAVQKNLVTIYWMPKIFGKKYPLEVTTINDVNQKLMKISAELERLPPSYFKFLVDPAGTFQWRNIANEKCLSLHSFGIAIDINVNYSDYWQWDLKKTDQPITEQVPLNYRNQIPWEIVAIFQKHGFIWGGKWYHYDTMHFEYRPELLPSHDKNTSPKKQ